MPHGISLVRNPAAYSRRIDHPESYQADHPAMHQNRSHKREWPLNQFRPFRKQGYRVGRPHEPMYTLSRAPQSFLENSSPFSRPSRIEPQAPRGSIVTSCGPPWAAAPHIDPSEGEPAHTPQDADHAPHTSLDTSSLMQFAPFRRYMRLCGSILDSRLNLFGSLANQSPVRREIATRFLGPSV